MHLVLYRSNIDEIIRQKSKSPREFMKKWIGKMNCYGKKKCGQYLLKKFM